MATQLERITKFLSEFGAADTKVLMDIADVSKSRLYEIVKQKNSTFEIKNGTIYPKHPGIIKDREMPVKEVEVVKEVEIECKKKHYDKDEAKELYDEIKRQAHSDWLERANNIEEDIRKHVEKEVKETYDQMLKDQLAAAREQIENEVYEEYSDKYYMPAWADKHYLFKKKLMEYGGESDAKLDPEEIYTDDFKNQLRVLINACNNKQTPDFEDIADILDVFALSLRNQIMEVAE